MTEDKTMLPPEKKTAEDRIYTLSEAAQLLGCSQRKLWGLFRSGEIKASKRLAAGLQVIPAY